MYISKKKNVLVPVNSLKERAVKNEPVLKSHYGVVPNISIGIFISSVLRNA